MPPSIASLEFTGKFPTLSKLSILKTFLMKLDRSLTSGIANNSKRFWFLRSAFIFNYRLHSVIHSHLIGQIFRNLSVLRFRFRKLKGILSLFELLAAKIHCNHIFIFLLGRTEGLGVRQLSIINTVNNKKRYQAGINKWTQSYFLLRKKIILFTEWPKDFYLIEFKS